MKYRVHFEPMDIEIDEEYFDYYSKGEWSLSKISETGKVPEILRIVRLDKNGMFEVE